MLLLFLLFVSLPSPFNILHRQKASPVKEKRHYGSDTCCAPAWIQYGRIFTMSTDSINIRSRAEQLQAFCYYFSRSNMKKADEEETICQSALVVFRSSICILTRLNILSIFCHGAVSHRLDVIECLFLHLGIVCLFSPPRRKGPAMRARPTPRVDLNSRMGWRSWGLRPDPWVGV